MIDQIVDLAARVAKLEHQAAGSVRYAKVAEVDPAAGTVRLDLGGGTSGQFLSPEIPYAQVAGALKVHAPPSVGQQMIVMAPGGDIRQAVSVPLGWGGENANPGADGATNVLTFGGVTISLDGDSVAIEAGGCAIVLGSDGIAVTGGSVTHNGQVIDDTHVHGGVVPGASTSSVPE